MDITDLTDDGMLAELGRRLQRQRLARNMTQAEVAAEAGLGEATVQRVERGESVQLRSVLKLMRALGLLEALDAALPESVELPIVELERRQRGTRARARRRSPRPGAEGRAPWRWGGEEPG